MAQQRSIYLLNEEQVLYYWADIADGLKDVPHFFEYYSSEWVFEQVKTGHLLVWALSDGVIRGIVITRICVFPKQKVFEILALYGVAMLDFFNEMEDAFMHIAKSHGCQTISALCRPGLKKMLKGFHAEVEAVVLRRTIPNLKDQ